MTTIDDALAAVLDEQEKRLAQRTYRNYLQVIERARPTGMGGDEHLATIAGEWRILEVGNVYPWTRRRAA